MEPIIDNGYACVYIHRGAIPESRRRLIENETLDSVDLRPRQLSIGGRDVMTPRSIGSFSDEGVSYDYSGFRDTVRTEWPPLVSGLRDYVQEYINNSYFPTGKYNYVLINRYENGKQRIGWHSDNEKGLNIGVPIVSISLGASRDFQLKPSKKYQEMLGKDTVTVTLDDGDMLIMAGETQKYYGHCVPQRLRVHDSRINYTFRSVA